MGIYERRSSIPLVFQNENPQSQNDRHKIAAMENAHNITITKSQEVKVRTEEDSIAFWMQREPSENEKIDIAKRHERRFSQLQSDIEQCKEPEEEPSSHPIQKLYSDESFLSE